MEQLGRYVIPAPGIAGLNKEKSQSIIGSEWATTALNAVVDLAGRFAARKGWVNQTSSPITGGSNSNWLTRLHEYINSSGSTSLIAISYSVGARESTDNGATWANVNGSTSLSPDAELVNFNGKVLAIGGLNALAVKSSIGGTFANVVATSGSAPTNARIGGTAAFGRLWVISDLQTISYCALLDETKWAAADGAGVIDMRQIWTQGTDTIVAVRAFSSRLVVFGRRHIVIFSDGRGSALGLDPANIYVEDMIEGNGTECPGSIQPIGEGDLMFLGRFGIHSLVRILQEQKSPTNDVSRNSRQYLSSIMATMDNAAKTYVRSAYSPQEGLYLLSFPPTAGSTTINEMLAVDVRFPLPDGTNRIFEWSMAPNSLCNRTNGDLLFGFIGVVGKYSGYQDNGSPYTMMWYSGYLDMEDENIIVKELKNVRVLSATAGAYIPTLKWGFDFAGTQYSASVTYSGTTTSEYGVGQYNISEYGVSSIQHSDRLPGAGTGQFIRLGLEIVINGYSYAIQSIHMLYTQGRIA